ncbi:DsrE family protein [Nocardia sp. NPDC046473]|uniref:DsrE/DsrF/TusD sulfur relay family protein n=1 Tax=Nocardia sp. NPDC046473 TaxID=3155733 RepID=UPI0033CFA0F4
MKFLFVLHDPPYGTERTYNGLRWAQRMLVGESENEVKVFFMGDAVGAVRPGQKTPDGYYNIETMVRSIVEHGGALGSCGTCLDARGIPDTDLVKGTHRSSMPELGRWTEWADTVINV